MNNYFGIYVQALLAKNTVTTLQKQLNTIKNLQIKITPTFGKINKSEIAKINNDLKKQLNEMQKIAQSDVTPNIDKDKLDEVNKTLSNTGKALESDLGGGLKKATKELSLFENQSATVKNVANDLLGTVSKVAIWGIATNAVYGTKRALAELFQEYVKIEDKLVSIDRVTDNFDMGKIFEGSYQSAQKYGASLQDMLGSVEEIARSYGHLNEQQALAAAEAGILASTIAEMDGKDAVGAIIAVSNAYGLAIENGQLLIDMANEVDNNFSVTAAGIADAWEKSSAAAKTFGVEIHNVTGYIAAISTVTQESGKVIGNSLKTIFSRITTMEPAMKSIEGAGVKIFDGMTGEARRVEDILQDLAGTWGDLTKIQQQNIGVSVAGRFQLTRFLALMNNWEIASDASTTALMSEGSAIRENAEYLDSYTSKLNQLSNAKAALTEAIGSSSTSFFGKGWLDFNITLNETAAAYFKVTDSVVVFTGAAFILLTYLAKTENGYRLITSALNLMLPKKYADIAATKAQEFSIGKFSAKLDILNVKTKLYTVSENLATTAKMKGAMASAAAASGAKGQALGYGIASVAAKGLSVACGILSVAMNAIPFMALVTGLGMALTWITSTIDKNKEQNKVLKEQNTALSTNKKALKDIRDAYAKLNEQMDVNDKILNSDDYQQSQKYLELLAEKYVALKDILLDENILWEEKLKKMKQADAEADKQAKKRYEEAQNQLTSNLDDKYYATTSQTAQLHGDKDLSKLSWWDKGLFNMGTDYLKKYTQDYEKLISTVQSYAKSQEGVTNNENLYIAKIREVGLASARTGNDFYNLGVSIDKLANQYLKDGEQGVEPFRQALANLKIEGLDVESVINSLGNETESFSDDLINYKNTLAEASEGMSEFNDNSGNSLNEFLGTANETAKAIDNVLQYVKLFGKESSMTADRAEELSNSLFFMGEKVFDSGEELLNNINILNMISETLKIAQSDEEAYANSVANGIMYISKGRKKEFEVFRDNKIEELKTRKESLQQELKSHQLSIEGKESVGQTEAKVFNFERQVFANKLINIKKLEAGVVTSYKNMNDAAAGKGYKISNNNTQMNTLNNNLDSSKNTIKILQNQIKDLDNQINLWSNMKFIETTIDGFKKINKEVGKTIDYYELVEAVLLKYKDAMEAVKNELDVLNEKNKQLVEGSQAWFDNISQQEKAIIKYQNAIKEYIKQIQVQLTSDKLDIEEKSKLQNKIQDLTLEYEKLNTTLYKLTETQEKYYKGQIEDKLDLIKDLENKRHKTALENIKSEREAFQKQIDEQLALMKKANEARSYEKDLNKLQQERLNILSQISRLEGDDSRLAQSRLVDLNTELSDIDSQIDDLNYDRNNELREDALNDLSDDLEEHYDYLEDKEEDRNELVLSNLENTKETLDDLNLSLDGLNNELNRWGNILEGFSEWVKTFSDSSNSMPASNIVSAMVPVNSVDEDGNAATTQIVFNISGNSKDGKNIADTVVDSLLKAGVIKPGN